MYMYTTTTQHARAHDSIRAIRSIRLSTKDWLEIRNFHYSIREMNENVCILPVHHTYKHTHKHTHERTRRTREFNVMLCWFHVGAAVVVGGVVIERACSRLPVLLVRWAANERTRTRVQVCAWLSSTNNVIGLGTCAHVCADCLHVRARGAMRFGYKTAVRFVRARAHTHAMMVMMMAHI